MRAMEAIAVLALLAVLALFVIGPPLLRAVQNGARALVRHHNHDQPWEIDTEVSGGATYVFLTKPGETKQYIGKPIPLHLPHYEYDELLTERRLDAADKANSLNRRLTA